MLSTSFRNLLLVLLPWVLCACAGPTSPFGGVWLSSGDGQRVEIQDRNGSTATTSKDIRFKPSRQVLHDFSDLDVTVKSPEKISESHQLKVIYNGRDLTKTFTRNSDQKSVNESEMQFHLKSIKLRADQHHDIVLAFTRDGKNLLFARYLPPQCDPTAKANIESLTPFEPDPELIDHLETIAWRDGLNPAFLAGIIAQESGFDPYAVSDSNAVGLTQVTPIAEQEIRKLRPYWPADSRIEKNGPTAIKAAIATGRLSGKSDWRLDPRRSVEGGALYVKYLFDYWEKTENKTLLGSQNKADRASVILASYNSGSARVKKQIQETGSKWLEQENLQEAFKYVNRVSSYCYHFSGEDK